MQSSKHKKLWCLSEINVFGSHCCIVISFCLLLSVPLSLVKFSVRFSSKTENSQRMSDITNPKIRYGIICSDIYYVVFSSMIVFLMPKLSYEERFSSFLSTEQISQPLHEITVHSFMNDIVKSNVPVRRALLFRVLHSLGTHRVIHLDQMLYKIRQRIVRIVEHLANVHPHIRAILNTFQCAVMLIVQCHEHTNCSPVGM